MRKTLTSLLALCLAGTIMADEGMWLPSLISQRIDDMHEKGFHLSAEDIYSINQASLKDVGSSRVDLQACKLEYSIVSPK